MYLIFCIYLNFSVLFCHNFCFPIPIGIGKNARQNLLNLMHIHGLKPVVIDNLL